MGFDQQLDNQSQANATARSLFDISNPQRHSDRVMLNVKNPEPPISPANNHLHLKKSKTSVKENS